MTVFQFFENVYISLQNKILQMYNGMISFKTVWQSNPPTPVSRFDSVKVHLQKERKCVPCASRSREVSPLSLPLLGQTKPGTTSHWAQPVSPTHTHTHTHTHTRAHTHTHTHTKHWREETRQRERACERIQASLSLSLSVSLSLKCLFLYFLVFFTFSITFMFFYSVNLIHHLYVHSSSAFICSQSTHNFPLAVLRSIHLILSLPSATSLSLSLSLCIYIWTPLSGILTTASLFFRETSSDTQTSKTPRNPQNKEVGCRCL